MLEGRAWSPAGHGTIRGLWVEERRMDAVETRHWGTWEVGGRAVGWAIREEKSDGKASFMEKHICHVRLGKGTFFI